MQMGHTHNFVSFYSIYHTHSAIQLFAFSLVLIKKKQLPPKKTAALVFPSIAKPAVDAGQNNYKTKEEGEVQRKVKWHPVLQAGSFTPDLDIVFHEHHFMLCKPASADIPISLRGMEGAKPVLLQDSEQQVIASPV